MKPVKDELKVKDRFWGLIFLGTLFLGAIIWTSCGTYTKIIRGGILSIIVDQFLLGIWAIACLCIGLIAYLASQCYEDYKEMKKINKKEGEK